MIVKPHDISDIYDLLQSSILEVENYIKRNPKDNDLKELHVHLTKASELAELFDY